MNDFTKEQLEDIRDNIGKGTFSQLAGTEEDYQRIREKAQSMIDNYSDSTEAEIFQCYTGLAVGDDFFCNKQHMTTVDLLPAIHQLVTQCDGMIREPGIYALYLRLVKLK
jgi:hypothetical protein